MTRPQVSIVYTGRPRFQDVTKGNHREMIALIESVADTKIYMMTTDQVDQTDNVWHDLSGASQVWQFVNACSHAQESIIIKFRTDLWFTPISMSVIVHELNEIIYNNQDAAFLGSNWAEFLGHEHTRLKLRVLESVQDFVIMANRKCLRDPNNILHDVNFMMPNKLKCGTKVFNQILTPEARAHNVMCQIWLCRYHYDSPDHFTVGLDYVSSYKKQWKMPGAIPWMHSQKHRYTKK